MELRTLARPVELRSSDGPGPGTAVGYAYMFNSLSEDLGGFVEQIAPGAGRTAIETGTGNGELAALVDHDPTRIVGRTGNGTLRLAEDNVGARYEIDLPDTTVGRDLAESLRRRDIVGSSFAFRIAPDGLRWSMTDDGRDLATITNISWIRDVGPVTFPAYPQTEAALRSLAEHREVLRVRRRHLSAWVY